MIKKKLNFVSHEQLKIKNVFLFIQIYELQSYLNEIKQIK